MARIKIKKIDNQAARQVTFSKRRRGLFKKADQLAVLCGAEVGAIIFSTAGRPYIYSTSSMKDILNKYETSTNKSRKENELEFLNRNYAMLCTEALKKSNELMQLKGENIQTLDLEELTNMENKMEISLNQVLKIKEKRTIEEISIIRQQRNQLIEENNKLRDILMTTDGEHPLAIESDNIIQENGQLSESPIDSCPINEDAFSVTLKLGLSSFS